MNNTIKANEQEHITDNTDTETNNDAGILLSNTPSEIKTLDDLMAHAIKYAGVTMQYSGQLRPTYFLIGSEGPVIIRHRPHASQDEMKGFMNNARMMNCVYDASACVIALESWVAMSGGGTDVQEKVILMSEDRNLQKVTFLEIVRDTKGEFLKFTESQNPPKPNPGKKTFDPIIPTMLPNEDTLSLFRSNLEALKFQKAKLGISWNK